ncbi:unnamed protein product [Caenorhabditis auriculariae]|uniref:NNMT/PNMT/TEMT family protein n=1 Tax=Caenorhabditis auriculariae TaxID=2777116 RepID=A0A8S1H332_9PELO|nr:unnamed protein product [Caenorhabditis auriculariae]
MVRKRAISQISNRALVSRGGVFLAAQRVRVLHCGVRVRRVHEEPVSPVQLRPLFSPFPYPSLVITHKNPSGSTRKVTSDSYQKKEKCTKKEEKEEICAAEEHRDKFNPDAYLESFYKSASEDTAMQVVLFFLPGILYRLPSELDSVLDLGAGPTVYLPIALRDRAKSIYTSDYAPANREKLQSWIENRSTFNWENVCKWIGNIEATMESPQEMQEKARRLLKAVLEVDVHAAPVVRGVHWKVDGCGEIPRKFQVVSTVFCLEYSCETLQGYFQAVKGACSLIEDGGYLIQGGVLDATTYNFDGKTFRCHCLKQNHIIEALKKNGMASAASDGYKFITHDDIFLLISKKLK